MELGAFSVSLNVKDIQASREFYEKIGFQVVFGEITENWLIMRNRDHTIGLFQGMFEKNILTFNPGWDKDNNTLDEYKDVRKLQQEIKSSGITILSEADENGSGPASFTIIDPDGNPILFDQHV